MYGPAECTVKATSAVVNHGTATSRATSIGGGLGTCAWVVNPSNHHKLVPVGAVGELVLEGPLVGDGYLGDAEKTAASFIHDPDWLLRGGAEYHGRHGRLYKTGDLVSYNADGTLTFIGRKDGQIKINGQRLELGDVEYNLAASLNADLEVQLAAEVIVPQDSDKPMLVAFMQTRQVGDLEPEIGTLIAGLNDRLASKVPGYMIPSAYIGVKKLPLSTSGKMDRKQLRAIGAELTRLELMALNSAKAERRLPSTAKELCLQKLWASVLGIEAELISADDSFLHIGGDSIQAMKLTVRARDQGLHITVADIVRSPRLSQMVFHLKSQAEKLSVDGPGYRRFSLLPPGSRSEIEQQLVDYGHSLDNVLDILPVTDQQARYLLGTYTTARSAVFYHTLDRDDAFDLSRIEHAVASLFRGLEMLRTVFIAYKDMFLQAVLEHIDMVIGYFESATESLDEYTLKLKKQDLLCDLYFGKPLTKVSIIRQTQEHTYRVVVRLSHAQYDGIALGKMWNAFEDAYNSIWTHDTESSFAQYMYTSSLSNKQKTTEYWRDLLQGCNRTAIRRQTTPRLGYTLGPEIVKTLPAAIVQSEDFTFATILKAAWSYVLARHSATNDIIFGSLVHGRNQPGSEDIFGPCLNIVPSRIVFQENWSARDLITAVNAQQLASMQFETMGSRDIIRNCTNWPKWSYFSSVIIDQNFEQRPMQKSTVDFDSADLSTGDVDDVEVYVTSTPGPHSTEIHMGFAAQVISQDLAH